jgi:integrase
MTAGRMIFRSTKSSASRSEAFRLSAANRRNEKTFFRGGTNTIIRRALENEPESPLFATALGKTGKLSRRPPMRTDAADMLKRRLKQAGLPAHYSPHSFRATGITNFLENDDTLEAAQRIAGHADSRTTKLYDRRGQKVLLEDMERIRY